MKGTMVETSPGTWYLRVYDRTADKQTRRTVKGSKRQAETELARFVAEVESGNAPMSGSSRWGSTWTGGWGRSPLRFSPVRSGLIGAG